ncbi:MAG: hypothetical protein ACREPA_08180 [Candidatus Dormibacteraceae bacterium]
MDGMPMWTTYGQNASQQAVHDYLVSIGGFDNSGTYRWAVPPTLNHFEQSNTYVLQQIGPGGGGTINDSGPSDLWSYTTVDINFNFPPAYNIETQSYYHGNPLWRYPNQDYKHYFPAQRYTPTGNIWVDDPHPPSN